MRASVRTKIVLIASAAMLLAVAVNTAFSGYFFATEYSSAIESEAGLIGQSLKMDMEKLMGFGIPLSQVTGFDLRCQDAVDSYDILLHAYVVDMDGRVLFKSSTVWETSVSGPVMEAVENGEDAFVLHTDEDDEDHYDFITPIVSPSGARTGAVVIGIPVEEVTGKVNSLIVFSALVAIIAFLLAMVLLLVTLSSWVTSPLAKLTNAIQGVVQKGETNTVDIHSGDEIGKLAESFNSMITEIKASNEKAARHTEELEANVQERTKTLDQKLAELNDTKTAVLNMMEDMEKSNKELVVTKGKLEDSFGKLREVDVKKDQFISIAAHELKTPLTSIHGFSQLLRDKRISKDAGKRDRYLEIIDNESMRLAKLVNEILDLSRVDLGTIRFSFEDVNLNELVDSVRKEIEVPIKAKGIKAEFAIEKGLPSITTDRERLTQVILNLMTNSVKYTEKGKITLSVKKDAGNVRFSVKDTGIGVAKENHSKMFQRFYQVDSSYTRKAGGTGLGLSLCKEFVTRLGGDIWFESDLGRGSEFFFTLPIRLPEAVKQMERDREEKLGAKNSEAKKKEAEKAKEEGKQETQAAQENEGTAKLQDVKGAKDAEAKGKVPKTPKGIVKRKKK